ncbi:MAG: T9SS type A sorting domain-containing protein [Chitinophagales bacterium]
MKSLFTVFLALGSFILLHAQSVQRSFDHDNLNRTYRIYVSVNYDANKPVPLVFAFHGMGDQAANFQGIGFNQLADQDTFIVIYPQAEVDQDFNATAWNAGVGIPGFYLNSDINDVDFVSKLIDSLSNEFSIDTQRVYATGFSLGGYMSQRLACELDARIAAIASVAGLIGNDINCNPGAPVPVLHMHGTADSTITYGGEFPIPNFGYTKVGLSVDEMVANWTGINNCTEPVEEDSIPDTANDNLTIDRFTYPMCEAESEVILYKIKHAGHEWMSSPGNDIDATIAIWEFFQKHSRKSTSVGIANAEFDNTIQVYPNPVSNTLFVKMREAADRIMLTNLLGQELSRIENPMNLNIALSLADINPGMYLLTVQKGSGQSTFKILKE